MRAGTAKVIHFLMILAMVTTVMSCTGRKHFVLEPGAEYLIITGEGADSLTLRAAEELERYFTLITSRPLMKAIQGNRDCRTVSIGRNAVTDSTVAADINSLSRDGFVISADRKNLLIAGNNGKADLGAVYAFLEEFGGCMRFTSTEEYILPLNKISVPPMHRVYEPAFRFRVAHFPDRNSPVFTEWNRLSTFNDWGMFVHTFHQLMPPSEYFISHPEYYSLVNGRRIQDGQLCLSNPEVIRILTENLGKRIEESPDKIYWSVSQNDCINYCECDECRKLYEKYGSVSGAYVEMANRIAEKFPDRQISTLAYQFTRQAPHNIKPAPNVNIMFCSIECNRSMPLGTDPSQRRLRQRHDRLGAL